MTADIALIEKREELKRRLAAGEYKTLVDVFLEWTNRVIQKITRRATLLPIWLITVILILVLALISFVAFYVAGGLISTNNLVEFLKSDYELGVLGLLLLSGVLNIMGLILNNQYIGRIFVLWRDHVLDATETVGSLNKFEDWLEKVCNRRMHLLFTIVGGLVNSFYIAITIPYLGLFLSNILILILANMLGYAFIYLFFMVIFLSAGLRRYDLKLFAADPASSELISRLSGILSFFVYLIASWAAYLTIGSALAGLLPSLGIAPVLVVWLPIIATFILNQTSLSSLIRRVKWKTLNEIQARVEKLQTTENYADKETMESINRLMDYHDRVKATRDSALDFRTYLSFINSLLLPLLALLLGNLDLVLQLSGRKP